MDLERAEDLLRQGRYAEAVDRFRELLSMDPERPDLRGRVAEAYRLAGNPERAFHHFHKAATLYARAKDLLGAARMLEAANAVSPNEPDVLYRLAEVLKQLGKHRPLVAVLQNLVKAAAAPGDRRRLWALDELCQLTPHELDVQVERAKVLSEVGRVREAVLIWQRVSDHLGARGVDFVPWLERAAKAAPDEPRIGVPLAQLLLQNNRPREALALLVPYYEKFPDDVPVLETLVGALRTLGAKDKVLPARMELLKARTRAGERAQTLEEVKALLTERPRDPRVLEVCAHACAAFGLTGEACRLWFDLAGIYEQHEMAKERDRVVLRILETKPDHEGALALGARVLRATGRVAEAEQLERKLEEVRSRSRDELPSLDAEDTRAPTAAPRGTTAPIPEHTEDEPGTVVLNDTDVLEVSSAVPEEEDDYDDVFDSDTPALATHAGEAPMPDVTAELAGGSMLDDTREELPAALEEPTFRMDARMTAELSALREELEDETALELEAQAEITEPPRVRTASRAHGRLVSDLLQEMSEDDRRS